LRKRCLRGRGEEELQGLVVGPDGGFTPKQKEKKKTLLRAKVSEKDGGEGGLSHTTFRPEERLREWKREKPRRFSANSPRGRWTG